MLLTRRSAPVVLPPLILVTPVSPWLRHRPTPTSSSCWLVGSRPTGDVKGARGARSAPPPPIRSRRRSAPRSPRFTCAGTSGPRPRRPRKPRWRSTRRTSRRNRALGLINAAAVEASERADADAAGATASATRSPISSGRPPGDGPTADPTCITHWAGSTSATGYSEKAVESLTRGPQPESEIRREVVWRWRRPTRRPRTLKSAIGTLEEIVEDEPRVASALAQYQEDAGC